MRTPSRATGAARRRDFLLAPSPPSLVCSSSKPLPCRDAARSGDRIVLPQVGTEWLIDAAGCDPAALRDGATLRGVCERLLADLRLHVVGAGTWHQFPPP